MLQKKKSAVRRIRSSQDTDVFVTKWVMSASVFTHHKCGQGALFARLCVFVFEVFLCSLLYRWQGH